MKSATISSYLMKFCSTALLLISSIAYATETQTVYVLNYTDNTVSVVSNNTVTKTIPVGTNPLKIALTPDGTAAYVVNSQSNNVSVISVSKNAVVATIGVGINPTAIAITPDGKTAYVINSDNQTGNTVTPITIATNTAGSPITVGTNPVAIAITSDSKIAYVANNQSGTVTAITTSSNSVSATITVGAEPSSIGVTADDLNVLVACTQVRNPNKVYVIPVGSSTSSSNISIESGGITSSDISFLLIGKNTAYLLDSQSSNNNSVVFFMDTNSYAVTLPNTDVGVNCINMVLTPDEKSIYLTDNTAGNVVNLATKSGALIDIPLQGSYLSAIAITSDGKTVYATSAVGPYITPITVATNIAGSPITVGNGPIAIGIVPIPITPPPSPPSVNPISELVDAMRLYSPVKIQKGNTF